MKAFLIAAAMFFLGCCYSYAGLQEWTFETTSDPFSGGRKIEVSFSSSLRSGIFIICDTAESGFDVRAVAGWDYVTDLDGVRPWGKFAVDGEILFDAQGSARAFGSNIAGVQILLGQYEALILAKAMKAARSQIALQDGISNKPHLLSARGSTKAGRALEECLERQSASGPASVGRGKPDPAERGLALAKFLGYAVAVQKKCRGYSLKPEHTNFETLGAEVAAETTKHLEGMVIDGDREFADMSCSDAADRVVALSEGMTHKQIWKLD